MDKTPKQQAVIDKDELLSAIDTKLSTVNATSRLDRVEEFLYFGNGDSLKSWMGKYGEKLDNVEEAVKVIPALKTSVELHHAEPHLWIIVKDPRFWAVVVGGFIILHFVSTYIPNIWNVIMLTLGLPGFVIPLQ